VLHSYPTSLKKENQSMKKIKEFVYQNPVRVAAFVSSTIALLIAFVVPDAPTEPAIAFVLSALGLGEFAQRAENKKTDEALFSDVPDEE
jgi:hypothetical protein